MQRNSARAGSAFANSPRGMFLQRVRAFLLILPLFLISSFCSAADAPAELAFPRSQAEVRHDKADAPQGRVVDGPDGFRIEPSSEADGAKMEVIFPVPSLWHGQLVLEGELRASSEAGRDAGQSGLVIHLRPPPPPADADGKPKTEPPVFQHIAIIGSEWETLRLPVELPSSEAPLELALTPSYFKQPVEVRNLRLRRLQEGEDLVAPASYPGQAADAPWREKARQMIDQHRKQSLTVHVVDALGKPVPGATVRVRQQRHAYPFGTAVTATHLAGEADADALTYRAQFLRLFNCAVFENDLKWPQWSGGNPKPRDQRLTLEAMAWLRDHGITTKGHTMIWPSWRMTPDWLRSLEDDPAALQAAILRHIRDIGTATAPFAQYWDVMNEPMSHHDILDLLGPEKAAEWFHAAREVLPESRLVMNEFDIVGNGGSAPRRAKFLKFVADLRSHDAPLDVLGFQAHFWSDRLTPPERIWEIIDEVHDASGLPLMVSEFDMNLASDAIQADYTRDFLTAWFAHPATEAFIMWGFWGGAHWMGERGALFRKDWTPKPNLEAYEQLVLGDWWTDETLMSDAEGKISLRVFRGTHQVTIEENGPPSAFRFVSVDQTPCDLRVVLPRKQPD